VVVGYSIHESGMTNRAWKWTAAGGRVDLGGFGGLEARALGINQSGAIRRLRDRCRRRRARVCLDEGSGLADIGTLPGGGNVFPQSINNRGEVAGYVTTANGNVPFVWPGNGCARPAGHVVGRRRAGLGDGFRAYNTGRIVGEGTWIFGGTRAFVTDTNGSAPSPLQTFGGETGEAYGINDAGQIVGDVEQSNGSQHPFLFDAWSMFDLGTLGGVDATVFFINDSAISRQRGHCERRGTCLHLEHGGGLEDLNPLIDPGLGWVLNEAHAITEEGIVVGNGTVGGKPRAFLLRATQRAGRAPAHGPRGIEHELHRPPVSPAALYLDAKAWDDVRWK